MEIWQMLLIICPLAFFAALVDAAAGGGGLISLTAYLLTGMPPALASGSNKLSACLGTASSAITFHRAGKILWKEAIIAAVGAIPGAIIGARLLLFIPAEKARLLLFIAIPTAAVAITLLPRRKKIRNPAPALRYFFCALIGLVIGVYDGLIGPGTGTFLILLFSALIGIELIEASGCAKIVNLASNIGALFTWITAGQVLYAVALPATLFSMIGAQVGTRLALRGGARFIAIMLYIVLALMLIWLAFQIFGQ